MNSVSAKKRKSTVLPRSTVDYLKNWMMSPDHIAHPYPTEKEKAEIMAATGIELKQLTNWFVNNRKRFWKPRVEARLQQQLQAQKAVSLVSRSQNTGIANISPPVYNSQQTTAILRFNRMNVISSSPETVTHQVKEVPTTLQPPFQIITNHTTFIPPCAPTNEADNSNSQVVSMGSASYSSDTDSNSISNGSNDEENDVIFTHADNWMQSPRSRRSPLRKRQVIIGNAIAQTLQAVEESDTQRRSPPKEIKAPVMKRVRSKSDLFCYATSRNIMPRPRTFTLQSPDNPKIEPSPKRRCGEDWQTACRNARHGYDTSLPTLEEAASLFGYSVRKD